MKKQLKTLLPVMGLCLAGSAMADEPLKNKLNGEFATLSGKVTSVSADQFILKVNGDYATVEMDDYDWDADGFKLFKGDKVVVSGRVDHDYLEKKKLEAGSVYVKNLNTYYYANSDDEEDLGPYLSTTYITAESLPENATYDAQGVVIAIDGRDFTLDTGFRIITVDTDDLIFNPMDDKGYTQVDLGDTVRVSGEIDDDFIEGKELEAEFISEV